ncbi:CaiB/BaiF CoA transferase family protein [Xanthobacter aminoxidans]|uniref:CaiB/BaiF CoA transferase family protein n=1 Tax=Xanthobacter aminoxidans TaxID=186280 RepID=UPI003729C0D5
MNTSAAQVPEGPRDAGPLRHLRVLDLTQFLSGPYATQILGDLGAEVIKVEAPEGDMTRRLPPNFVGEDSAYYLSVNRNKKSLAVDLKSDAGRALVCDLARTCDVVVENFRPGVLDRLGLSYAQLSADQPGLVWCSISGFGQDGPYRDRPAYDMIVQAMSGGMSLTGEVDGHSVRSGIPLGDIAAGMYAVIGILAALADRDRSGKGRAVDVAMLDCQIAMLSYQAAYFLASGHVPGRQGRGHDSIPTYRAFTCADGADVVITANTERMWRSLCGVLGHPELVGDPRFAVNAARYENRLALWSIIEAAFRTRAAEAWVEALVAAEIPATVVNTLDRSLTDPHVLHRRMVVETQGPDGERLRVAGNPVKYLGEAEPAHAFPPRLGSDEDDVLARVLNLSVGAIAALRDSGVIGRRDTKTAPAGAQAGAARTGGA